MDSLFSSAATHRSDCCSQSKVTEAGHETCQRLTPPQKPKKPQKAKTKHGGGIKTKKIETLSPAWLSPTSCFHGHCVPSVSIDNRLLRSAAADTHTHRFSLLCDSACLSNRWCVCVCYGWQSSDDSCSHTHWISVPHRLILHFQTLSPLKGTAPSVLQGCTTSFCTGR